MEKNTVLSKVSQIDQVLAQTLPQIKDNEYYISLSITTAHDLSISIAKGEKVLEVIELERFLNDKNTSVGRIPRQKQNKIFADKNLSYLHKDKIIALLYEIKNYITRKYTDQFEAGIFVERTKHYLFSRLFYNNSEYKIDVKKIFNANTWYLGSHHVSHAAGAFYQSSFDESLIISFDGGSQDGLFNIFYIDKNNGIKHLQEIKSFLCDGYARLGSLFKEINQPKKLDTLQMVYPGKIMGLAAYGKSDTKLTELIKKYLLCNPLDKRSLLSIEHQFMRYGINIEYCHDKYRYSPEYRKEQKDLHGLEDQESYDFAASLQQAFEELLLEIIDPYIKKYPDTPLCLTGGGALNILSNTRIYNEYNKLPFVPPDPHDGGLSLGALLYLIRPNEPYKNPYSGVELLDRDLLSTYIYEKYNDVESNDYLIKNVQNDIEQIASFLYEGKIIGVARGRSERGPRALGNRSILADASISGMKDKINSKVKGREWFRPFAPIVRLEDVSTYFEWEYESRYMSFSPLVRKEYRDVLESITHVDGTSRVQTITRDQNEFIYDLLTELEKQSGVGVVLNTSFNVDSKPIVSSVRDSLQVLEDTKLDGVLIDDVLILKNR